jgi:glycosyltransferase involved in cell wall biosynthesis
MGGSQYQAMLLEDVLAHRDGVEVAFFAARVPPPGSVSDRRVVRSGKAVRLRRYGHLWDYFSLQRRLQEFEPHVIYQRVRCAHTGIAARYAVRHGIPMVWHIANDKDCRMKPGLLQLFRDPFRVIDNAISQYGMHSANYIIAQSDFQRRLIWKNFGLRVTDVIRNFHPRPEEKEEKNREFTVVWIANLKNQKRPELFLDLARSLQNIESLRFEVIGGSFGNPALQQAYVNSVEKLPNVEYLGPMEQPEVNRRLARAHVLVNTSISEGFSNTFIQAWLRGVPVVTLGVNPDDLLDDSALGWSCNTLGEMRERILHLYNRKDDLSALEATAKSTALGLFSMKNAEELADLLLAATDTHEKL